MHHAIAATLGRAKLNLVVCLWTKGGLDAAGQIHNPTDVTP